MSTHIWCLQITFPWVICRARGHVDAPCPVRCSKTDAHTPNLLPSLVLCHNSEDRLGKGPRLKKWNHMNREGGVDSYFIHSYVLDNPMNKAINTAISYVECTRPTKGGSLSTYRLNWYSHKATQSRQTTSQCIRWRLCIQQSMRYKPIKWMPICPRCPQHRRQNEATCISINLKELLNT